jgi:butyryl-CoA dehydrogenase
MTATIQKASAVPALADHSVALGQALQQIGVATQKAWATANPAEALANAVPYMQAFGHMVLAWIWLDVAARALELDPVQTSVTTQGRLGAARFFFHYELPKIGAWLQVVQLRDLTCADFPADAF